MFSDVKVFCNWAKIVYKVNFFGKICFVVWTLQDEFEVLIHMYVIICLFGIKKYEKKSLNKRKNVQNKIA